MVLVLTLFNGGGGDKGKSTSRTTPTHEASQQVVADDPLPSETPSLTPSSSPTATDTALPTLTEGEIQATINAEVNNIYATATQTAADMQTATAAFGFTVETGTAQVLTLTATNASPTPSPDYPKTAQALVTQTEIAHRTQVELDKTLTATHATHTPTAGPTLDAETTALLRAEVEVSSNAEWTPFIKDFDGVEMVLVPVECFNNPVF